MWWLGAETDNEELGTSALFFTLATLLGLHIALIVEIIRKEFSFYHTCVALQFIALYTVLLNGHFPVGRQSRHTVGRVGFATLLGLFLGELCYATAITASAIEVATACSMGELLLNGFVLVNHNWVVLVYMLFVLALKYRNDWASQRISAKLVRFGVYQTQCFLSSFFMFVAIQFQIVGQFQKQMDPSENSWSFGQILAIVALVAFLFEFYRQGNAKIEGSAENRWQTWLVHGISPNYGSGLIGSH